MANILYAWEYGVDLEHINIFLPITQKLRAEGHNIRVSLPFSSTNFSLINDILIENGLQCIDIPSTPMKKSDKKIGTHAELMQLLSCFYSQSEFQFSLKSWLALFEKETPDLVICDFAPVALLSARQLGIPTVLFDLGFIAPKTYKILPAFIDHPICSLQSVHKASPTIAEQESMDDLLSLVNTAFSDFNFSSLDNFIDIYKADKTLWLNYSELSPFTETNNSQLPAVAVSENDGIPPRWKLNRFESPKIFAYLKNDDPVSTIFLQALRAHNNLDAIIYIPNCPDEIKSAYDSVNLVIESLPVNIAQALKEADIIINNGDSGLTAQSLLVGKPLLLSPTSFEQCLNANRAVRLGAAISLKADVTHKSVFDGIYTLLANGFYAVSARAFALKYQPLDTEIIANIIIETISLKKRNHFESAHKKSEQMVTN